MPESDEYTVRVGVVCIADTGQLIFGTVVVNVTGTCSVFDALQAAVEYVVEGGLAWGPHGYKCSSVDFAEVEEVVDGLHGNPSTEIHCE